MFLLYSDPAKKRKMVPEDAQEAVKPNIGMYKNVATLF